MTTRDVLVNFGSLMKHTRSKEIFYETKLKEIRRAITVATRLNEAASKRPRDESLYGFCKRRELTSVFKDDRFGVWFDAIREDAMHNYLANALNTIINVQADLNSEKDEVYPEHIWRALFRALDGEKDDELRECAEQALGSLGFCSRHFEEFEELPQESYDMVVSRLIKVLHRAAEIETGLALASDLAIPSAVIGKKRRMQDSDRPSAAETAVPREAQ